MLVALRPTSARDEAMARLLLAFLALTAVTGQAHGNQNRALATPTVGPRDIKEGFQGPIVGVPMLEKPLFCVDGRSSLGVETTDGCLCAETSVWFVYSMPHL